MPETEVPNTIPQCKSPVRRHGRARWAQKAEAGHQGNCGKSAGELSPAGGGGVARFSRQRAQRVQRHGGVEEPRAYPYPSAHRTLEAASWSYYVLQLNQHEGELGVGGGEAAPTCADTVVSWLRGGSGTRVSEYKSQPCQFLAARPPS